MKKPEREMCFRGLMDRKRCVERGKARLSKQDIKYDVHCIVAEQDSNIDDRPFSNKSTHKQITPITAFL